MLQLSKYNNGTGNPFLPHALIIEIAVQHEDNFNVYGAGCPYNNKKICVIASAAGATGRITACFGKSNHNVCCLLVMISEMRLLYSKIYFVVYTSYRIFFP